MLGRESEVELHSCLFSQGAMGEFGRRSLVQQDSLTAADKVSLSHGIGAIDTDLPVEEFEVWEAIDGVVAVTVHQDHP